MRVGQKVEAGEELVLLESMKMEIPVVPEEPGTVVEIRVEPGDVVLVKGSLGSRMRLVVECLEGLPQGLPLGLPTGERV